MVSLKRIIILSTALWIIFWTWPLLAGEQKEIESPDSESGLFEFTDKREKSSIFFVEKNGEVYARYRLIDGRYGQLSLLNGQLEVFESKEYFPGIDRYIYSTRNVILPDGKQISVRNVDTRPKSQCPQELNRFLQVTTPSGRVLDKLSVFYKPKAPVSGSLKHCPSSSDDQEVYHTSIVSLRDIVIEKKSNTLFFIGGIREGDPAIGVKILVKSNGVISIENYCNIDDIYLSRPMYIERNLLGAEIDFNSILNDVVNIIISKKEESCP
jgi:hypothetical protein